MLRTAIIGYGGVARSHYTDIQFFQEGNPLRAEDDPIVELVAGCDISDTALARFTEDTGVTATYTDVATMLDQEKPDFVHIATCADAHVEPVLACAQRGIHVLCEKPLGVQPSDCDTMIAACDEAGVQFVTSHQRRSDPGFWYIRRLLDEGLIGKPLYVTGGVNDERGGGPVYHNLGSHLIDCLGIFTGPVSWVNAYCTQDWKPCSVADAIPGDRGAGLVLGDRIDLTIGHANGIQTTLQFNADAAKRLVGIVWGDEGRVGMFGNDFYHCNTPRPTPNDEWELVQFEAVAVATDSGYVNPPDWLAIKKELGAFPRAFMMREMIQRMEIGGEHTSSGRVGAVPIEVMQATWLSHLNGARVDFPVTERVSPLG